MRDYQPGTCDFRTSSSWRTLGEHRVPVAGPWLAEQTRRGIPGRARAAQLPAPVGGRGQQHPGLEPHRRAEMGDRRIDRDQEVELRQSGRGFGKVENAAADIVHQAAGAELLDVLLVRAALQAEDQQLRIAGQRQEVRERHGALAVLRLARHGGPVDADAQLRLVEPAELDAAVGRGLEIGRRQRPRSRHGRDAAATPSRHERRTRAASRPRRPRRR